MQKSKNEYGEYNNYQYVINNNSAYIYIGDKELTSDEYKMQGRKADNCINHFFEKTLRLGKMMMTDAGKEQSKIRLRRMIDFLYGYFEENDVPQWADYLTNYLDKEGVIFK